MQVVFTDYSKVPQDGRFGPKFSDHHAHPGGGGVTPCKKSLFLPCNNKELVRKINVKNHRKVVSGEGVKNTIICSLFGNPKV